MPNRDDLLRDETFNDCEGVDRRVFYTLTKERSMQTNRNSKAISLIIAKLQAKGMLSDAELDELLLNVIH